MNSARCRYCNHTIYWDRVFYAWFDTADTNGCSHAPNIPFRTGQHDPKEGD